MFEHIEKYLSRTHKASSRYFYIKEYVMGHSKDLITFGDDFKKMLISFNEDMKSGEDYKKVSMFKDTGKSKIKILEIYV